MHRYAQLTVDLETVAVRLAAAMARPNDRALRRAAGEWIADVLDDLARDAEWYALDPASNHSRDFAAHLRRNERS